MPIIEHPARMVDPTLLVNVSSIAERCGLPRTNVNAWTRSASFPAALDTPGLGGRTYFWPDVEAYIRARPNLLSTTTLPTPKEA